jgi:hypothetical protein
VDHPIAGADTLAQLSRRHRDPSHMSLLSSSVVVAVRVTVSNVRAVTVAGRAIRYDGRHRRADRVRDRQGEPL